MHLNFSSILILIHTQLFICLQHQIPISTAIIIIIVIIVIIIIIIIIIIVIIIIIFCSLTRTTCVPLI